MPLVSRWLVRTSLVFLVVGFTSGAAILVTKALGISPTAWTLLPAHVEFVLVGWTVQLTIGVAFWILPRFAGGSSRGQQGLAWAAFVLLNAGTILAGLGPLVHPSMSLFGRAFEAGAAAVFGLHAWQRVKPPSTEA